MDLTCQTPKDHSLYVSAPTSPSVWSPKSMQFYSAPASPTESEGNASFDHDFSPRKMERNEDLNSDFDDFEFETCRNFGSYGFGFETSQHFEYLSDDQELQTKEQQQQGQLGGPLPKIAFADELFCNGLVVPLKLPPRLQYVNDTKCVGLNSIASSPRSPSSGLRIPFSWRSVSSVDCDPFMVALEKVKGEKKRKNHENHYRRARSLSPFRTTTPKLSNDTRGWNQHQDNQGSPLEPKQCQLGPTPDGLVESKGSAYARWVRDQNKKMGQEKSSKVELSPKGPSKTKGWFRKGVKPVKTEQEGGPIKPTSSTLPGPKVKKGERGEESGEGSCNVETRVQKVGRFLLKYASFGRETNEGKPREQEKALVKPSYFRGLSFSFKGNANRNGKKKKENGESNMAITKAWPRPKLTLCLGYGIESPRTRT